MSKPGLKVSGFASTTAMFTPRWIEILSASWLCFILVGGTLLNGGTLFIFMKNKHLVTTNNVYVIALIINNLLICILATGMPIVAEIGGHWLQLMSMKSCIFEAFIVYLFGLASMFVLVAIAVSRFIAITRPFLAARISKIQAVFAVCICELFALCFAVAPLLGWGSYGLEAHGTSCGLDWRDRSDGFLSYLIVITAVCFIIPMATMMFSYIVIYKTVKQAGENSFMMHRHSIQTRKEMLLLKLSIAFVSAFLISWTPYTIVSFYIAYARPDHLDPLLSRSAALVAKSQVLWNPVLYIIIVDGFRRKIFDMLPCKKRNEPTTLATIALNNLVEYTDRNEQTSALRQKNHKINQNKHINTTEKVKENISMAEGQVKNPRIQEMATSKTENIQNVATEASCIPYEEGLSNIPKTARDKTVPLDSVEGKSKTFESLKGTSNEHMPYNAEGISPYALKGTSNITFVKSTSMKNVREKKNNICCNPDQLITKEIRIDHKTTVGSSSPLHSPVNRTAIVNLISEDTDLIPIDSL
ncbi:visual pigment-like receptor peropsin [Mercenaria mercenaria]|uniref:visual pigment-like receptor peropsin n=1 Tax=Mercenaria mercenaria TaxID=6596 RepID=UPI00234F0202|nr:visual pigment-like receptor peropsin [Mercenaria mercenaria]